MGKIGRQTEVRTRRSEVRTWSKPRCGHDQTEVRTLPAKGIDMAKPRYGHCQTSWARRDEQP